MPNAVLVAKVVLMMGGFIRMLGHSAELVPPLLLNKSDQFVKLSSKNINYKIPLVVLIGYIGEFASGLPTRLFPVQVNYLYQTIFRVNPHKTLSWKEIDSSSKEVLTGGYSKLHKLGNYYNSVMQNNRLVVDNPQFISATTTGTEE